MTRKEVLEKADACVNGQRQTDYGTPEDNFKVVADLWNGYLGCHESIKPTDVAMMMALLCIAGVRSGHATEDSFIDLAGYAACGGEIETEPAEQSLITYQNKVKEHIQVSCKHIYDERRNNNE